MKYAAAAQLLVNELLPGNSSLFTATMSNRPRMRDLGVGAVRVGSGEVHYRDVGPVGAGADRRCRWRGRLLKGGLEI